MNTEKIIEVLSREEGLCNDALSDNGMHCAIGALLFHAGYTNEVIESLDGELGLPYKRYEYDMDSPEAKARQMLLDEYDLAIDDARDIINENDLGGQETPEERLRRIIEVVRNWEEG